MHPHADGDQDADGDADCNGNGCCRGKGMAGTGYGDRSSGGGCSDSSTSMGVQRGVSTGMAVPRVCHSAPISPSDKRRVTPEEPGKRQSGNTVNAGDMAL